MLLFGGEGSAFWELLFRASPAAILGWVVRDFISRGREMAKEGRCSTLCWCRSLWGSHNHTEEKLEEGGKVGRRGRRRVRGGRGVSPPGRRYWHPPGQVFPCFRERIAPLRNLESPLSCPPPILRSGPRRLSPPCTGRVGSAREQHLRGVRGSPSSAQPLSPPPSASGSALPRWLLLHAGTELKGTAQCVVAGGRRAASHIGQLHHEHIENPTLLTARLGFRFRAPDASSEAQNLKFFLPLVGQGMPDRKDEAATAESCVSS